ncbi:MAG TPA: PqqD family protein [Thermoanaerobaculia bacterium]|nr:PqqD family protein [Thermoanaerobaculia bacterium]
MMRLWPNTPTITSEAFEDEVVIVNFESGSYYSVSGSGVEIWKAVERGATPAEIVRVLDSLFEAEPGRIETAVAAFLRELEKEALVVARDGPFAGSDRGAAAVAGGRTPFPSPLLNAFTDMQELLWLDPVHETDEAGWPAARVPEPL